jgi:hypothetical protein
MTNTMAQHAICAILEAAMPSRRVTLRIEGAEPGQEHVRLSDFLHQLEAARNALRKTEESMAGRAVLDWRIVNLSHNSPATVVIEPIFSADDETVRPERGEDVVDRFFGYMRDLTIRADAPAELDRATLVAFKELAAPIRKDRVRMTISSNGDSLEVAGAVEVVIDAILAPTTKTPGHIDGRLEFINIHGGKNVFRVYPVVGPQHVACVFPNALLSDARDAVGRHVRVFGEVTYLKRDAFPQSIKVERVQLLADDAQLPSLLDLRGMAPEATGTLSSEDFVRELRSGE